MRHVPTDEEICYTKLNGQKISIPSHGIRTCIIDFTLSRLHLAGTKTISYDMCDESFYIGEGDYQFDIYRKMREIIRDDWTGYYPKTNVFVRGVSCF